MKKKKRLKKWQHKQLKAVCDMHRPQKSDFASFSAVLKKTKLKPGECIHSADTTFGNNFQHQKRKIHTEVRKTNATILACALQAHSLEYIYRTDVVG